MLHDLQDYHATSADLARLASEAKIGLLGLYHLVPAPRNAMASGAFKAGLPDGALITEDGMMISLQPIQKRLRWSEFQLEAKVKIQRKRYRNPL